MEKLSGYGQAQQNRYVLASALLEIVADQESRLDRSAASLQANESLASMLRFALSDLLSLAEEMEESDSTKTSFDMIKWISDKIDLTLDRIERLDVAKSSQASLSDSASVERNAAIIPSLYKYAVDVVSLPAATLADVGC